MPKEWKSIPLIKAVEALLRVPARLQLRESFGHPDQDRERATNSKITQKNTK